MPRAAFHAFSGTGNSLDLARRLAASLEARGYMAEIREISRREIEGLGRGARAGRGGPVTGREGGDLDLFVFPVFALSVPRIVQRYIRRLGEPTSPASGSRPKAAVLSTNGKISARFRDGHEGQALAQAERMLKRRGWDVAFRETFDYPQSISSFLPIQDEARREAIMALVDPRIDAFAEDLAAGKARRRPCGTLAHLAGWPFGWAYALVGRPCWAMLFAADGRCDGCGACAARCPAGAISMRGGRPAWSYACEGCERCINLCPRKAIQTSLLRLAIVVALMAALDLCRLRPLVYSALGGLPAPVAGIAWTAASIALGFAALRAVDLVLVALGRIPALRPFLGFGLTRYFRRYPGPRSGGRARR